MACSRFFQAMNTGLTSLVKLPDESLRNLSGALIESSINHRIGIKNHLYLVFPQNIVSIIELYSHHR